MIRQTVRRPGVTLMEVMIATAILAVGMLAIMPLFPIGAVSMARAINQNRAADHAAASDAMFRFYWKKAWLDPNGGGVRGSGLSAYGASGDEMILALDRVRMNNGQFAYDPLFVDPTIGVDISPLSSQPSYSVFVDPVGFQTQVIPTKYYVAGLTPTANPTPPPTQFLRLPQRTSLAASKTAGTASLIRTTTLLDDVTWDMSGEPANYTGQIERAGRYNCAWLIQRPRNSTPHEVRLFVLIYGGRSSTDTPSSEQYFTGAYATGYYGPQLTQQVDPKPNAVTVPLPAGQSMPNIRRGGWVAFSVPVTPNPTGGGIRYPTLDFYRIAAITDDIANSSTITIEFEEPLRTYDTSTLLGDIAGGGSTLPYDKNTGSIYGTLVVFDNLIEVFDRGMVSAQAVSGR